MICYKVVDDRKSCGVSYKEEYSLTYTKDSVVSAVLGSLGIFCFKTKEDAEFYIIEDPPRISIIQVEGIGEPTYPEEIGDVTMQSVKSYYDRKDHTMVPPQGTICFPSVRVLE